jgi:sec-independent protein translocase protein TatB
MLDVGFSEILLTSAIALIVLGPERLPKVARQVGNWMGRARAMARQLSEQLEREVSADELMKAQAKQTPRANLPSGADFDPAYTPAAAPPAAAAPAAAVAPPAAESSMTDATPPAAEPTTAVEPVPAAAPPAAVAPDPIYGLDAASTTAAAMHAADPVIAESKAS